MPDEKTGRLDEEYVVQMKGITKVYPNGVAANQGVDFFLRRGEIHALMGENGAGKSTLMKMLFGLEQPTSGEIWVNGEKLSLTSPTVAISHGIGMVHQHFMLVPSLTVAENMVLGMAPRKGLFIDHAKAVAITKEYAEKYNLHVEPEAKVMDIPVGMKQKVEILKALVRGAKILILDEPTAVLTPQETDKLFQIMRNMKADGKAVLPAEDQADRKEHVGKGYFFTFSILKFLPYVSFWNQCIIQVHFKFKTFSAFFLYFPHCFSIFCIFRASQCLTALSVGTFSVVFHGFVVHFWILGNAVIFCSSLTIFRKDFIIMQFYLAPMEGLTGYVYRNAYHKYFPAADRYFTPFITNKKMSSRERNDILPEHNEGMTVIPQILTNQAEDFLSLTKELREYGYDTVNLNVRHGCRQAARLRAARVAEYARRVSR